MSKTELLTGTVNYIQKLSESRFEQYENVPNENSLDLTEYFERIQKVSTWTETDINDWQDDIKKMSNWSVQSW